MKVINEENEYYNQGLQANKVFHYKGFDLVNYSKTGRNITIYDSITHAWLAIASSLKEAKSWIDNNNYYPPGQNK